MYVLSGLSLQPQIEPASGRKEPTVMLAISRLVGQKLWLGRVAPDEGCRDKNNKGRVSGPCYYRQRSKLGGLFDAAEASLCL